MHRNKLKIERSRKNVKVFDLDFKTKVAYTPMRARENLEINEVENVNGARHKM